MTTAKTFQCPACGAPLDYPAKAAPSIRCRYCHNTVIVPQRDESARSGDPLPPGAETYTPPARSKLRPWVVVVIAIAGLLILVGALAPLLLIPLAVGTAVEMGPALQKAVSIPTATPIPIASPTPVFSPTPGFAQVVMSFGSEGSGPGLFEDSRSIAVDENGLIYTGEYQGGRIQVFDPQGKFLNQFLADTEKPLMSLSAGTQGRLFVVQGGEISVYDGAKGDLLEVVPRPEGKYFDNAIAALDGGLLAVSYRAQDEILRLGPDYQVRLSIPEAVSSRSEKSGMGLRLALDGNENIYALSAFNFSVFKFTAQGEFITRFASQGDQPGQLRAPNSIAVDGQGRVYVSDMRNVHVFAPDGRYLDSIPVDGVAFGLAFDRQGYLYVSARKQMSKFQILK